MGILIRFDSLITNGSNTDRVTLTRGAVVAGTYTIRLTVTDKLVARDTYISVVVA